MEQKHSKVIPLGRETVQSTEFVYSARDLNLQCKNSNNRAVLLSKTHFIVCETVIDNRTNL